MVLTRESLAIATSAANELLDRGNGLDAFDTALEILHATMGIPTLADNEELSERALDLESCCNWMWKQWHKQHDKGIRLTIRDIDELATDVLQDQADRARRAAMQPALF